MAPNPLHLGVALEGAGWHPAAWREPNSRPAELFGPGYWTDLVATAQRGLLDFVTFDDSLAVPGPRHGQDDGAVDQVRARIDAHLIVSRVAPVTRHIGLIPTVTTTHTEPFHVPTRRFIDRDKLHYIDFEGRFFNVRGPSITPRPPQGQPVVTALAHAPLIYEFAARAADLVFVTPGRAAGPAPILAQVAAAADRVGRTGERLRVYADLVVFLDTDAESGPQRLARLNETAGSEFDSDAAVFAGGADELADLLTAWSGQGIDGFRLRPGVNHHTAWWHPRAGSQIDFATFEHTARTAERGRFDFFVLAEGLILRERAGKIFDQDIIGRPDTFTVLASIAAVTEHLGLAGTINATFNEPYELARRFASLDHLSGGRAAWNVVTSFDAFTGQNFRRGGFLDPADRYVRAEETVNAVRALWDSWDVGDVVADRAAGRFLARPDAGAFSVHGSQFDISGRFTVPRSPQGRPVLLQAGVSPQGRDFAAANADAIFSPYGKLPEAVEFYRDIKSRAVAAGRAPGDIKILPSASFVLGDTEAEAVEKFRTISREQVTGQTAVIWSRSGIAICRATIPTARCPISIPIPRRRRSSRAAPSCTRTVSRRRRGCARWPRPSGSRCARW